MPAGPLSPADSLNQISLALGTPNDSPGWATALDPRTGEKIELKADATVKFKASSALKESAFEGLKKAKRKTVKAVNA